MPFIDLPSLPSIRTITTFVSSLFSQIPLGNLDIHSTSPSTSYKAFSNGPSCPVDSPLSCHNKTVAPDSCCFIYPGGQLLQTQFWDTNPTVGPDDSWTLHGLWPDLCDGSYPTYCNSAPQYHTIQSILTASDPDLVSYMETYWVPNAGRVESFWEHEWNKHGTCINTLAPSCYGDGYESGDEVVDFFTRTVALFKTLDTYSALAASSILPSTSQTYTLSELTAALESVTGHSVMLGCQGKRLNQAWYSFNVKGSLQSGDFVATEPVGGGLRCPATGILYLPKN